ncbi:blue light receptor [Borealophlyctis nickersoniae]|nr:blue light receptor [Borealophlyctis nickersoniae]
MAAKTNLSRHVTSVISHFTANKEGYRRLLNEVDDFLHVVSPSGVILFCSPSTRRFLGYSSEELSGRHVSEILHRDDRGLLLGNINTSCAERAEYFIYCRYQKKGGDFLLLEVRGKPYPDERTGAIKFVINTGREYRSKASMSIDSIMELRIENIRLRKKLEAALKEKGLDSKYHPLLRPADRHPSMLPSEIVGDEDSASTAGTSGGAGTGQRLGGWSAGRRNSSDADLGGSATGETPTSGRKRENDSSAEQLGGDTQKASKRKKQKSRIPQEELFCRQCGTTSSPEWRKGPAGPKTLCNACGLAFSKKLRKANKAKEREKEKEKDKGQEGNGSGSGNGDGDGDGSGELATSAGGPLDGVVGDAPGPPPSSAG